MKKVIILAVFAIVIFGCGMGKIYSEKNYIAGKETTTSTGSVMLSWITGAPNWFDPNLLDKGIMEELVYLGKSGNVIKIDYHQYYGNNRGWYIKDGFTQHLEYDLSSNQFISYKTIKIKVLSADGSNIVFIVQ